MGPGSGPAGGSVTLQPIEPGGGELVGPGPAGDPWDRWLGLYRSEETKKTYRRVVEEWAAWCASTNGVEVLDARPGDVTMWVEGLRRRGQVESTLARKVAALSSFYEWAREEGLTEARPIPRRRPKAGQAPVELGLSVAQVVHVLEVAGARPYGSQRNRAFLALLFYTGVRISEALALTIGDLREERGHRVITVAGKGGKRRTVPVVAQAMRELSAMIEQYPSWGQLADAPLFQTSSGKPWRRREAGEAVHRVGQRARVAIHPHLCRHTAATLMLDAGEPLDRVQAALGHSDPKTTIRYAQARDQLDKSPVYGLARLLSDRG
jgi:integrase/recombinase XerD